MHIGVCDALCVSSLYSSIHKSAQLRRHSEKVKTRMVTQKLSPEKTINRKYDFVCALHILIISLPMAGLGCVATKPQLCSDSVIPFGCPPTLTTTVLCCLNCRRHKFSHNNIIETRYTISEAYNQPGQQSARRAGRTTRTYD